MTMIMMIASGMLKRENIDDDDDCKRDGCRVKTLMMMVASETFEIKKILGIEKVSSALLFKSLILERIMQRKRKNNIPEKDVVGTMTMTIMIMTMMK